MCFLRNTIRSLATGLVLCLTVGANAQHPETYSRVTIDLSEVAGGVSGLLRLGIAADHGQVKPGVAITTDLSGSELTILQQNGIPYHSDIADVQAWYVDHASDPAPADLRSVECTPPPDIAVPEHFNLGTMGGYYTWDEMKDGLDEMSAAYPDLISAKASIGESLEGRALYMVRISNNPNVDQGKPEVLYDALHHAREPASLSQVIFYMWHLLENYGTDPEITWLVDHTEMYFVPCVNPDGYVYNETTNPNGGGMWRKNRRPNPDGSFGVDLNRNYGYEWGYDDSGSSPNYTSEVYRGASGFSEPETQVMRDFCNAHQFRLALNYHTYGNLLIYPWGYGYSIYTPDSAAFSDYGLLLARDNHYLNGTGDQTVQYVTNGDSDDWMYGEQTSKPKIYSMTPEAGLGSEGFWPPSSRITAICKENVTQNLRMAHLAGVFGETADRMGPVLADIQPSIRFELKRLGQESGPITVSIAPLDLVQSVGPEKTYSDLDLLETRSDSISINLDPTITAGELVRYVLITDFGGYAERDTITKVFGTPVVALTDNGITLGNWTGNWGVTTSIYFSPPSCFADSPNGNYSNNADKKLSLSEPVDLTGMGTASLSFWAKWDIEPAYDQVQVLASTDNDLWYPLCGIYTHAGSVDQSFGEPLYDGRQPAWVQEDMDLGDYLGAPVWIRFELRSDQGATADGFFLDDVQVTTTAIGPAAVPEIPGADAFSLVPNPANSPVRVLYNLSSVSPASKLNVRNALGSTVLDLPLTERNGEVILSTTDWASGLYFITLTGVGNALPVQRLVVMGR